MAANWSSVNNISGMMQVANTESGGYFWVSMLFMIWAILLISMMGFGIEVALLGASFAAVMIGFIMVYMGLVGWSWLLMYIGVLLATFLWIIYNQRD